MLSQFGKRYATLDDLDRSTINDKSGRSLRQIERGGRHALYGRDRQYQLFQANDAGVAFRVIADLKRNLERLVPLVFRGTELWLDYDNAGRWINLDPAHRFVIERFLRSGPALPGPVTAGGSNGGNRGGFGGNDGGYGGNGGGTYGVNRSIRPGSYRGMGAANWRRYG